MIFRQALVLATCTFALFAGVSSPAAATSRPNILFIFSDDHAQNAISAYGEDSISDPCMGRVS